jgi:hypothetical protein
MEGRGERTKEVERRRKRGRERSGGGVGERWLA